VATPPSKHSKFSHMGLIVLREGAPYVLEASATVRYTPLKKWIERGAGHHYEIKRLRDSAATLTQEHLDALHQAGARFLGRPYDLTFDWSDDRMYCSELVYKIYDRALGIRIGELQRVRDFDLTDVAVQAKMRERYGNDAPLDAPVISPVAMEQSPLLITVVEK
jgi:Permuted papain-like amidase enzyme, YaeF/YiiX, C92 family